MVSYKVGAWKDITSGNSDAIIDKLAGLIKESGTPILLMFHHEAENNAWTNIKAAVYFDRSHEGCDWRIDTGGDIELDGYRDLINVPYFIKGE